MANALRTLALQYQSFNEEKWLKRTTEFMVYGDQLKVLRDEIDHILKAIQSGQGFGRIYSYHTCSRESIRDIRNLVDKWSCEEMFEQIYKEASQVLHHYDASKNCSQNNHQKPNAAAAAWIEYFAHWDENLNKWVGNENWKRYYYKYYPSRLPKEEK